MTNEQRRFEMTRADGRRLALRMEDGRVAFELDGAVILAIDRGEAWTLAEGLDAVATGA